MTLLIANRIHKTPKTNKTKKRIEYEKWQKIGVLLQRELELRIRSRDFIEERSVCCCILKMP